MKISVIRGAFANPFELQNFYPLKNQFDIQVITSKNPINSNIDLPVVKLYSPIDLPNFPYKFPILNRLFIDAHYLFNLESRIAGSDIVHTAETYYHYTYQAIKAKQKGLVKKIISTCWEVISHNNEGIRGRKEFKKLAYKYIDHFITPTKLAKQALVEEGVDSKRITVISVGIDLKKFKKLSYSSPTSEVGVLFVGRFVLEKGVKELLEAFSLLRKEFKNMTLTLIGSGNLPTGVVSRGRDLRPAGVKVKSVPYHLIHKEYQKADIFCLPSKATRYWREQYGMVLVEAMASGLPIVTTDTGAIKEVVGSAGIYAKPSDSQDLYIKLKRLIQDVKLRNRLSKVSLKWAKLRYDHRKIAQKIAKLYKNVV